MKKITVLAAIVVVVICSFVPGTKVTPYQQYYRSELNRFATQLHELRGKIPMADLATAAGRQQLAGAIHTVRATMKAEDLWLRYLEPVTYNRVNGALPVEWENEVFEKFEKPYRRVGGGLTLAELHLRGTAPVRDTLLRLIAAAEEAMETYKADSITKLLATPDHFLLANRLYLLNLAALYTTGFECPDKASIIPELRAMMVSVRGLYDVYNQSFAERTLPADYLAAYDRMIAYVRAQPDDYIAFDHFTFIRDYVNPLFGMNQQLINRYNAISQSYNDYTLSNSCTSIFDKALFMPQNSKGVYSLVKDPRALEQIKKMGKLLFYDPILSGNNQRSCASCHKPLQYFTDTTVATALTFDKSGRLPRNTPSLVNVVYNHLLMLDGKHLSLQAQGRDVITNPTEMGGKEEDIVEKVMSCREYRVAFKQLLKLIPEEKEVTLDHLISAISFYYRDFSDSYAPFDDAMNHNQPLDAASIRGFNLFMGKAQCGTCHYVPHFNGIKPPYISTEFEVAGVPDDKAYKKMGEDKGRYGINPAPETFMAFRTGTVRNVQYTGPYMHNGVFTTLEELVDFYNLGGGQGRQMDFKNQTLPADSLLLTGTEKEDLIAFLKSTNEKIPFTLPPDKLPQSARKELNARKVSGEY